MRGKETQSRADDNETTVRNRLTVYNDETEPLIAYYRAQGKLRTVAGEGELEDIQQRMIDIIEAEVNPLSASLEDMVVSHYGTQSDADSNVSISGGMVSKSKAKKIPARKKATKRKVTKKVAKRPPKRRVKRK